MGVHRLCGILKRMIREIFPVFNDRLVFKKLILMSSYVIIHE